MSLYEQLTNIVSQVGAEKKHWIIQRFDSVTLSWTSPANGSFLPSAFLASLEPTKAFSLPFREMPRALIDTNQSPP